MWALPTPARDWPFLDPAKRDSFECKKVIVRIAASGGRIFLWCAGTAIYGCWRSVSGIWHITSLTTGQLMTEQQASGFAGTHTVRNEDGIRILCLGDVMGRPGRQVLRERLPLLRQKLGLDMVIANGENAAGGIGLTVSTFRELLQAGVDVVTSGNHIWKHREILSLLDSSPVLLRPANYGARAPGRGGCVFTLGCGFRVGVLNLMGRIFLEAIDSPFDAADAALKELAAQGAGCVLLDFHAEASSEKRAMLHYLDGRVAAVLGTHTHVQTADAYVTDAGTASLTDLGMCGVERDSVIGMGKEAVMRRFTSCLPQSFKPAKGRASMNGALLEVSKNSGKALSIRLLRDTPVETVDAALTDI